VQLLEELFDGKSIEDLASDEVCPPIPFPHITPQPRRKSPFYSVCYNRIRVKRWLLCCSGFSAHLLDCWRR
jgi:hypothetical protein